MSRRFYYLSQKQSTVNFQSLYWFIFYCCLSVTLMFQISDRHLGSQNTHTHTHTHTYTHTHTHTCIQTHKHTHTHMFKAVSNTQSKSNAIQKPQNTIISNRVHEYISIEIVEVDYLRSSHP